jgi:hypothetical protein
VTQPTARLAFQVLSVTNRMPLLTVKALLVSKPRGLHPVRFGTQHGQSATLRHVAARP